MINEFDKIQKTSDFLKSEGMIKPSIGIILGTGLGHFAKSIRKKVTVKFEKCPFFPEATAIGHAGQVVYGEISEKKVIAMEGRFHFYEGYSMKETTYPVRVMKELGIKNLILSNAAGGLNPYFKLGDIMIISDHINLMGDSPLSGPNDDRLGDRFPDMYESYSSSLIKLAETTALELKMDIKKGIYAGVKGPQLETAAEYRFLRNIGADAVGMSTVPEVIVARHAKLKTVAFSSITDMCLPDALEPVDIGKILKTAERSEPVLTRLVSSMIQLM